MACVGPLLFEEKSMCSIFGILDIKSDAVALRKTALEMSNVYVTAVLIGPVYIAMTKRFWFMNVCRC